MVRVNQATLNARESVALERRVQNVLLCKYHCGAEDQRCTCCWCVYEQGTQA